MGVAAVSAFTVLLAESGDVSMRHVALEEESRGRIRSDGVA
jgi:hypothetical protein